MDSRCKYLIGLNCRSSKLAEYLTTLHAALFLEVSKDKVYRSAQPSNQS